MGEEHLRCRFWPRCSVHPGLERPRYFSAGNYAEMRELWLEGVQMVQIARSFDTHSGTVALIVGGKRKSARTTPGRKKAL